MARCSCWSPALVVGTAFVVAVAPRARAQATASFTSAQSAEGRALYERRCASCHGADLSGGSASPLAGSAFQTRWSRPGRSLDDLFYILRTSMPFGAGGSLAMNEYISILAYLLERNGQPAGTRELTADRATLSAARLAVAFAVRRDADDPPAAIKYPNPPYMEGRGGTKPTTTEPTHERLRSASTDGRDWLTHTRDYAGTRYSPLSEITTANVSRLRVACSFQVGGGRPSFQTGPVVYDGTMFITSSWSTIAIDAASCRPKWRHDWTPVPDAPALPTRGVAVKDGRVVRATADGHLLALDAATGALLWARRVGDLARAEMFTLPPLIYDDLIFIGPAVGEFGVRGWVAAFKLQNGERVWRFNIVPERGEPGSETWHQSPTIPMGGGALWTPLSLDVEREILYVPAANPAPDFPVAVRGGTNLYTNSVIALHARTGKLSWYDQLVPLDAHDWDLTQASPLYRATVKGKMRDAIATVGKDGILRVLDRETHERLFTAPVTTIKNAELPVTAAGVDACPGVLGGVEWNGPAYHPGANVLVVPAVDWCTRYAVDDTVRFVPGQSYLGGTVQMKSEQQGWITAVDASTGEVRWRYRSPRPMVGAVTATGGGLIFAGELTGDLLALDAATGNVRFRHFTGGAVGGGVVTYSVAGRQYVAVASGSPSRFWEDRFPGSPTITVFALDGAR